MIEPPSPSTLPATIAIPNPRPLRSVIMGLVEMPDRKISESISLSFIKAKASRVTMEFFSADSFNRSRLIPMPSSWITTSTLRPDSWMMEISSSPAADLPFLSLISGFSIPWSMQLRIRWIKGSFNSSRIRRSISVSAPLMDMSICLPNSFPRSRAIFGTISVNEENGKSKVLLISNNMSSTILPTEWLNRSKSRCNTCKLG